MSEQTNKIESVKQLRDELKLQAHLFGAEAKDLYNELETSWQKVEAELTPAADAASTAAENISEATSLLVDTISEGYTNIKNSLPKK